MFLCAEDRETLAKIRARLAEAPDPLDEADHRTRHFPMGDHLRRRECGQWHSLDRTCAYVHRDDAFMLAGWDRTFGPLTFCDCPC